MSDLRQSKLRAIGGETVDDRRRANRQPALWMGRCHIQNEPSDLWRECAIIDVSTLGVGMDLFHQPDPIELLGLWQDGELRLDLSSSRRITLRLELGSAVDLMVVGEVRNAGSRPDGIVRVGIEFVDLTDIERSVLALLERRVTEGPSEPGPVPSVPRDDDVRGRPAEDTLGLDVEDTLGLDVEDTLGLDVEDTLRQDVAGPLGQRPEDPQSRVGTLRLPIGIPGYELFAKGVSYMTNRPFLVEATRSLDLVGRPVCNFLVTCQGWLPKPWRDTPDRENHDEDVVRDHDEDVVRAGPTEGNPPVSEVVPIRAGPYESDQV